MNAISSGPFTFEPGGALRVSGEASRRWEVRYGIEFFAERILPDPLTRDEVVNLFSGDTAAFVERARNEHWPERVSLVDQGSGSEVAHFLSYSSCGMTPGLADDRSRYWLLSANGLYSRAVTLTEFAKIAAEESAPANSWIAGMLDDDVLTADPGQWRAPTSWEIRHVVGEGSFTRISGAAAATLVGVTPQNFRKYTARDDASTRQKMSFAMWHLLLQKLGVQKA